MEPIEYAADLPEGTPAPVRRPICGGASIAMLVGSVNLFVCTMGTPSSESEPVGLITLAMALAGVVLGIAGRMRHERYRGLATAGILLNGVWLGCVGILLLFAYGAKRAWDWH
jgi:hypothetical protein